MICVNDFTGPLVDKFGPVFIAVPAAGRYPISAFIEPICRPRRRCRSWQLIEILVAVPSTAVEIHSLPALLVLLLVGQVVVGGGIVFGPNAVVESLLIDGFRGRDHSVVPSPCRSPGRWWWRSVVLVPLLRVVHGGRVLAAKGRSDYPCAELRRAGRLSWTASLTISVAHFVGITSSGSVVLLLRCSRCRDGQSLENLYGRIVVVSPKLVPIYAIDLQLGWWVEDQVQVVRLQLQLLKWHVP